MEKPKSCHLNIAMMHRAHFFINDRLEKKSFNNFFNGIWEKQNYPNDADVQRRMVLKKRKLRSLISESGKTSSTKFWSKFTLMYRNNVKSHEHYGIFLKWSIWTIGCWSCTIGSLQSPIDHPALRYLVSCRSMPSQKAQKLWPNTWPTDPKYSVITVSISLIPFTRPFLGPPNLWIVKVSNVDKIPTAD